MKLLFAGQLAPARERGAKLKAHAARVADRIGPLLLDLEQRQLRDRQQWLGETLSAPR